MDKYLLVILPKNKEERFGIIIGIIATIAILVIVHFSIDIAALALVIVGGIIGKFVTEFIQSSIKEIKEIIRLGNLNKVRRNHRELMYNAQ